MEGVRCKMTVQTVTLNLPTTTYERIKRAADKLRRPVDDVLSEAVVAAALVADSTPQSLRSALAQMAYLNDAVLWQLARATMPQAQAARLEELHHEQQREGLTEEEKGEERELASLYRDTILVRAQAAVLLKQRGYDVSDLSQFEPLA